MNIFKEFFISLAKPGEYRSFLKLSMVRIFIYQFFISVIGFVAILLMELVAQLAMGSVKNYGDILKNAAPHYVAATLGYLWIGMCFSTLALSIIFLAIHRIRKNNEKSFKEIYIYTAHALTISALVNSYMGFYATLVAIAFYYMAVKTDREEKRLGTVGLKYKEGIK